MTASLCLAILLTCACSKEPSRMLEALDDSVVVLEEPSPLGHPSTNPTPNTVVAKLARHEQVVLLDETFYKDYVAYEVRTADGKTGYVIGSSGSTRIIDRPG